MSDSNYSKLISWLEGEAKAVREIEQKARVALYDNNDESAYRDLLKEKAKLLSHLAESGRDKVSDLSAEQKNMMMKKLERFSQSASSSLEVGSIFFMSALLYPEDYQEGQPNDLELFIQSLQDRSD